MAAQIVGTASAASISDPVQLQMRAVNMLNRCKALILADEPMYTFALQDLEEAQKALIQLAAVDRL